MGVCESELLSVGVCEIETELLCVCLCVCV